MLDQKVRRIIEVANFMCSMPHLSATVSFYSDGKPYISGRQGYTEAHGPIDRLALAAAMKLANM